MPAPAFAGSDCHVPAEELQSGATNIVRELKVAFAKNSRRRVRVWSTDPLVVRIDGKKRFMAWTDIDARFEEVFGPRVREAITEGRLRRVGYTWVLGDKAVFIGFHRYGKGCRLEIDHVFEDRPSEESK